MSAYERNLHQTVTYWAPGDTDAYGKRSYSEPSHLTGRWEDRAEMVHDKRGQEIVSKSRIFLPQDVDLDGYVALGTYYDLDPTTTSGAEEIRQIARVPDLRAIKTLYVVYV